MIYLYALTDVLHSGVGYIIRLFYSTFGAPHIVRTPEEILSIPKRCILICPRVFPFDSRVSDFHPIPAMDATYTSEAIIVGSFFWESVTYPARMTQSQNLVHYLHVPSTFLLKTFQHPRAFHFPPPVKAFPKRAKAPRSKALGVLIASVHGRKNLAAINELARRLPDYKIIVVGKYAQMVQHIEPNVEIWGFVSDDTLKEFYHYIDWFIVLSEGEGYCLPAREALKCGTPIIAPRHTTFLDIEGTPGVYTVSAKPVRLPKPWDDGAVYYEPNLEEIAEIVRNVRAPEPQDVHDPTPSFGAWREFWKHKINEIKSRFDREARIVVKETPALFGLYPERATVGLNHVCRLWARKTNSRCFHLCYDTVHGYNGVIVVPFYEWCTPTNTVASILRALRKNNPHATIVLWVHSFYTHDVFQSLADYYDVLAATTPQLRRNLTHENTVIVLPNPIGYSARRADGDYWLVWGVNKTAFPLALRVLQHAGDKALVLTTPEFAASDWARNHPNIEFNFSAPLDDDELERVVDNAKGYLCFDFVIPNAAGEASAKIPYVLRKNKPVIANCAPRTMFYRKFLRMLDLPLDVDEAMNHAAHIARTMREQADEFIPRNVPTEEDELRAFQQFIERAKTAAKWRAL